MTASAPPTEPDSAAHHVWASRYRHGAERCLDDSLHRVACALGAAEPDQAEDWTERFFAVMQSRRFLPGGRIIAGAGTGQRVTLANCFVMGAIEDSIPGIFRALGEGAVTMQQGGGVGYDFSTLRPAGMLTDGSGRTASGPVSFMQLWDSMCATMTATGARRGAMMATLRCDHPDIAAFIAAKQQAGALANFNLSVLVTDTFMAAVRAGQDWPLVFPQADGSLAVHGMVDARALWDRLLRAAYASAEPGVLFIDRINRLNNLAYCETIHATNPCGEVPLPAYGACVLGSLNLAAFVINPFADDARIDHAALARVAGLATRMLNKALSVSGFPLPAHTEQALATRRIGLGVMGLADALILLGLRYDTENAREAAAAAMRTICHAAYAQSVELAREKGPFPRFARDAYLAAPFVSALPAAIRDGIARHGIRNSHLTAIAPTGSISLAAGGLSGGIEPAQSSIVCRMIRQPDGSSRDFTTINHTVQCWQALGRSALPPAFVAAAQVAPRAHLAMQAALQAHVDNAISKTVTVPADYPFAAFRSVFDEAFDLGLKGCTVYRLGTRPGQPVKTQGTGTAFARR